MSRRAAVSLEPAVQVAGLQVALAGSGQYIVDDINLTIPPGEVLGLVGESGSGKTTLGLALLGHTRRGARITKGAVRIDGRDIVAASVPERRSMWGRTVSYVPQDPRSAINPALRIGLQLAEILTAHGVGATSAERQERVRETLDDVRLPTDASFLRRYPHQLSGGELQRVGLAMAFACRPLVIVFDEPTTGLDVTTQAHVLRTVRRLCQEHRVAAMYVTHDLAVVADIAMQVGVMYAGRVVEFGPSRAIFEGAAHPYARRLVRAAPATSGRTHPQGIPGTAPRPGQRPGGCSFAPRCAHVRDVCTKTFPPVEGIGVRHTVRCLRHAEIAAGLEDRPVFVVAPPADGAEIVFRADGITASYGAKQVLHDVSISVGARECVALVGESGSGKSTLAHCIVGLHTQFEGQLEFAGSPLARRSRERSRDTRRRVQCVFQNPYGSLNPRRTIGQSIGQPLELFYSLSYRDRLARVGEALERVALSTTVASRYPDQLSGGERQRVAIARALACEPTLLVCDEITSALDVSVQASIIELLHRLQNEMGLAMLFVTHNLPLVRSIAQRVAVMSQGTIVELGPTDRVMDAPEAEYTQRLLADSLTVPRSAA